MSIYSGFPMREMESKYNITLFDLVLTLGARVAGTIKHRTYEQLKQNRSEVKFLMHLKKLHRKLKCLEENKHHKPLFS